MARSPSADDKAAPAPARENTAHEAALDAINVDENGRFVDEPADREPKGEKKRKAIQLERLGEALVHLKPGQLVRVPLPDDLRAAVVECQRIRDKKAFGGYRRQVQLIGKIMRTVDAPPIAAALEALREEGTIASVAFQGAERWRKELLDDGDAALARLAEAHKDLDRTALRQLVRAAKDERARQEKNPQVPSTNQKKLFRTLHDLLRAGVPEEAAALASESDVDESPPHV